MRKIICILTISFFSLCFAQEQETILSIEEEKISKSEVFDLLAKRYPQEVSEVLRELIVRAIIKIEVERENIDIPKEEIISKVLEEINDTKKKIEDELGKNWQEYLDEKSITERNLKRDLFIQWKYSLSLQQLIKLFELRQKHIEIRHIMVETETKAKEILNKIQNGADFSTLVSQESLATSTNKTQGKITAFSGELPEDMEKSIWNMPVGLIRQPVLSTGSYHIVEILKVHNGNENATWSMLKNSIYSSLAEKPISPRDFGRWLNYMKKRHKITQKLE